MQLLKELIAIRQTLKEQDKGFFDVHNPQDVKEMLDLIKVKIKQELNSPDGAVYQILDDTQFAQSYEFPSFNIKNEHFDVASHKVKFTIEQFSNDLNSYDPGDMGNHGQPVQLDDPADVDFDCELQLRDYGNNIVRKEFIDDIDSDVINIGRVFKVTGTRVVSTVRDHVDADRWSYHQSQDDEDDPRDGDDGDGSWSDDDEDDPRH